MILNEQISSLLGPLPPLPNRDPEGTDSWFLWEEDADDKTFFACLPGLLHSSDKIMDSKVRKLICKSQISVLSI